VLRRWRAFSFYLCMRKAARHLVVSIVPEGVELDHLTLQHPGLLRLPAAKRQQKSSFKFNVFYFILHSINYTTIYYGIRYRWRPEFIVGDP
jgi:hypothetical protein